MLCFCILIFNYCRHLPPWLLPGYGAAGGGGRFPGGTETQPHNWKKYVSFFKISYCIYPVSRVELFPWLESKNNVERLVSRVFIVILHKICRNVSAKFY